MVTPSTELASILSIAAGNADPGVVHPTFGVIMAHAASPTDYLRKAVDDPNPLTDLRVRYDESSREMLHLNVRALAEHDAGIIERMAALHGDQTVADVLASLQTTTAPPVADDAVPADEVGVELYRYVNAFGGWDDAERIARGIRDRTTDDASEPPPWAVGAAALVLALRGADGADELFTRSIRSERCVVDAFFTGLRWASVEAKRNRDLARAAQILDETLATCEHLPEPSEEDVATIAGMTRNFRGLLAVRSRDLDAADGLSVDAVASLEHAWSSSPEEARDERARYVWMALLNRAQLAWFTQQRPLALERFEQALVFAREFDPRAVHSSLSVLAYSHLQSGDPRSALPLAEEASQLAMHEYDPRLVQQIRKILLRCYLELDLTHDAGELAARGPYYWRDDS